MYNINVRFCRYRHHTLAFYAHVYIQYKVNLILWHSGLWIFYMSISLTHEMFSVVNHCQSEIQLQVLIKETLKISRIMRKKCRVQYKLYKYVLFFLMVNLWGVFLKNTVKVKLQNVWKGLLWQLWKVLSYYLKREHHLLCTLKFEKVTYNSEKLFGSTVCGYKPI